ncbi:MAG: TolC family protein [Armatimonadota bacterium]
MLAAHSHTGLFPALSLAALILLLGMVSAAPAAAQVPPAITVVPMMPAVPTTPLTVDDAVQFALCYNPTVTLGAQEVQRAGTQVEVALAGKRPDVNLSGNFTYTPSVSTVDLPGTGGEAGSTVELGSKYSAGAQLNVIQPLFPAIRWRAPITQARAGVSINLENLSRIQQQIAFQTRQAFFQYLSAQELLQVAQDAVNVAQAQLNLAKTTVAAGVAAPLDIYQAEATLADAEVNMVRAQNGVEVAQSGLATQLGLPSSARIAIVAPKELPAVPTGVDALIEQAIAQRPEVVTLTYRRQQVLANMDLIRLEKLPAVNLQASYNQTLLGGSLFGADGLSISAVVALNLYNGGQTKAELAGAQIQLAELDTNLQQLRLSIGFDVRQAWLNLQNAVKQLTAAQRQLDAANEALRIAKIRYQAGEGIVLEVEQAQLRHTQALTSQAQARFQAHTAAAQLQFALGIPIGAVCPPGTTPATTAPAK